MVSIGTEPHFPRRFADWRNSGFGGGMFPTSSPVDIVMMDAAPLECTIRSRRVSCVEVMTAYLDHIENLNPKVNAIVALQDRAGLLAQARERDAQLARAVEVREAYSALDA